MPRPSDFEATLTGEKSPEGFSYASNSEPHLVRRARIIQAHPEIRTLFGTDSRIAWVTLAVAVLQFAVAAFFQSAHAKHSPYGSWFVILPVAYLVGAILNHWLAMTVHECAHNLAFKSPTANRWLAIFANFPFVAPMAMSFIRYHIQHHKFLGVEGKDTDFPHPAEVRLIGNSRIRKFFWLLFYLLTYSFRSLTFIQPPNRWELINVAIQLGVNVAIVAIFGWTALAYLALCTLFGMSLHPVAAHFIHEHYTFKPGQETYSYYGPLNWVTYNVGYHIEHHDFMNVPGFRLPALRAMAPEYYAPMDTQHSWTGVLTEFIASKEIGLASRIVRKKRVFHVSESKRQAVS